MSNFVTCPHCDVAIEVVKLNCCIFRCGIYKETGKQIDPHMPKEECDRLANHGLIHGCGKPFRVDQVVDVSTNEASFVVKICEYI